MTDRYVIVYRDGKHGPEHDREASDLWVEALKRNRHLAYRPAYRIRIRMKPRDIPKMLDDYWARRGEEITRAINYLDQHRIYVETTGRSKTAGAEK